VSAHLSCWYDNDSFVRSVQRIADYSSANACPHTVSVPVPPAFGIEVFVNVGTRCGAVKECDKPETQTVTIIARPRPRTRRTLVDPVGIRPSITSLNPNMLSFPDGTSSRQIEPLAVTPEPFSSDARSVPFEFRGSSPGEFATLTISLVIQTDDRTKVIDSSLRVLTPSVAGTINISGGVHVSPPVDKIRILSVISDTDNYAMGQSDLNHLILLKERKEQDIEHVPILAPTFGRLQEHLAIKQHNPNANCFDVIYFACHGDQQGQYFVYTGERIESTAITGAISFHIDALREQRITRFPVVIFNSCNSYSLAESLRHILPCVIGHEGLVDAGACHRFCKGFFDSLDRSLDWRTAVSNGYHQATSKEILGNYRPWFWINTQRYTPSRLNSIL
jgi:hypothetical protein